MEITRKFYPKNRREWREWLERNHQSQKEIWVIYYKKHTGKPRVDYGAAVDEALCFGWIDGTVKRIDEERYAQRFTPRSRKSRWSDTNVRKYKKLLRSGLVTLPGKAAFNAKQGVYTAVQGKGAYQWHMTHKIGKNPTLEQRIAWHREHQKVCACRPVPKLLSQYFR